MRGAKARQARKMLSCVPGRTKYRDVVSATRRVMFDEKKAEIIHISETEYKSLKAKRKAAEARGGDFDVRFGTETSYQRFCEGARPQYQMLKKLMADKSNTMVADAPPKLLGTRRQNKAMREARRDRLSKNNTAND